MALFFLLKRSIHYNKGYSAGLTCNSCLPCPLESTTKCDASNIKCYFTALNNLVSCKQCLLIEALFQILCSNMIKRYHCAYESDRSFYAFWFHCEIAWDRNYSTFLNKVIFCGIQLATPNTNKSLHEFFRKINAFGFSNTFPFSCQNTADLCFIYFCYFGFLLPVRLFK